MKRTIATCFFLLAVCLPGLLFAQSADNELIRQIKKNYIAAVASTDDSEKKLVSELTAITPEKDASDQNAVELRQKYPLAPVEAERWVREQRTDGSWGDINYKDRRRSGWKAKAHADRALALSRYYHDHRGTLSDEDRDALSKAIHAAFRYWFTEKPVCLNWWYNEIGIPRTLGPAFLLMENELSEAEKQAAIEVMQKARIGRTGQNKVWLAGNVLIRGLLQNDAALVKEARDAIAGEIVTGKEEGIKDDWSFHQHGAQQQFGNYGLSFLSNMAFYSAVFSGTPLAFSPRQQEILISLLLKGYRWIVWRGYWDVNALNRQLFRNADIDKSFWLRFTALSLMKGSDARTAREIKEMITETSLGNSGNARFTGHKHFGDSDYTLHRTKKWMASLRMASQRVIGTELINEDNLKGFYMADGALYTYVRGDEYHHIFPLWNWRLVPGITAYQNEAPIPNPYKVDGRNHSRKVGGSSYGENGVSAMELNRDKLQAYKSWIFTRDFILCMGCGIQADSAASLATSIDQRHYAGKDWSDGSRFFHDNTGYIILQADTCKKSVVNAEGDWSHFMGSYKPKKEKGRLYSLHIAHDTARPASYLYLVLPGTTRRKTENFNTESIDILRNDTEAQAVVIDGLCYVSAYNATTVTLPGKKDVAIAQPGTYIIDAADGTFIRNDAFR